MPSKRGKLKYILPAVTVVAAVPVILVAGVALGDRNYAVVSPIILVLATLMFFLSFERRTPKAREIVPIAVMAALAAVGRLAFAQLPEFKPILAIVIIAAIPFGPEAGFMTGTLAMLASDFFFGIGPWTPWQMYCCGLTGFLAGLIFRREGTRRLWAMCLYGFLSAYVYGAVIDLWTASVASGRITMPAVLAAYATGLPASTVLGAATAFFLLILARPIMRKLERIKTKYGLGETDA